MTDEIVNQSAPAPEAAPAAAVDVSVSTPAPEITPPAVETPKTESVAVEKPAETILGADVKEPTAVEPQNPEDKKTDVQKEPAQPTDKKDAPVESPAEDKLPEYQPFVLPEGIKEDTEKMTEFSTMLGNFEKVSGATHEEVQKFGQAAVDYHIGLLNDTVAALNKSYQDQWAKQTEQWRKDFESDPEIGGNRKDTTVKAAQAFIRTHGGTTEQQKEFRSLLEKTGLGNHPVMIRMLANANIARSEGKPLTANAPPAQKLGKLEKMYGKRNK